MTPGAPRGCPMHAASAGGLSNDTSSVRPQQNGSAAKCPVDHTAATSPSAAEAADAEKPPLECPMGFGAGGTAKLDPLACIICRTLFFDAAKTACQHSFCRFCIAPFRDCPICGADCQPLTPDAEMQDIVDTYIDVHSRNHQLIGQALAAPLQNEGAEESAERSMASFMLQLGLRSFAGGNLEAALYRLGACEGQLRAMLPGHGGTANATEGRGAGATDEQLGVQLGAVCGSLGDCHRRLGHVEQARQRYQDSVEHLQRCAVPSDEVKHALSVSLNKLGDLQHWRGDVSAACPCYEDALALRRQLTEHADEQTSISTRLDLVVSLVKVADAKEALSDAADAQALLEEARGLAVDLTDVVAGDDKASMAKLKGIQAYFDSK